MKRRKLRRPVKIILVIIILLTINNFISFPTNEKAMYVPSNQLIKKEKNYTVKTSFIGDLLYEQPLYDWMGTDYDERGYYDLVEPYFLNDDLTLANMEVPIGGQELGISGSGYSFNAPEQIGKQIVDIGIDAVNLANNHANDAGIKGRSNTIDFFKKHNILTTGVYSSVNDRKVIKTKLINNITFGFLGYTYKTNTLDVENQDLIGYYRDLDTMKLDEKHKKIIKDEVMQAKKVSDILIVSVHWGNEFTYKVNDEQRELANYLNELGVDIIIGHHSHCIQPIEWIENNGQRTLVAYSLGSFVSADNKVTRASDEFANAYNVSMILQINFEKYNNKITINDVQYIPIINYYDKNLENFKLIPLDIYTEQLEKSHNRYSKGLTKQFVIDSFNNVIDEQFKSN